MIESIFTAPVASAETREHLDTDLHPQEEQLIAGAAAIRRREFQTGRGCARIALGRLGLPGVAILAGTRGEPLWPAGVVGSITHCSAYRACVVARADALASLGIDAEPNLPLPPGVLDRVAFGAEHDGEVEDPDVCTDRLLFCVKEAIFKAWFPLAKEWLGFEDVEVSIDLQERRFSARRLSPSLQSEQPLPRTFDGRWALEDGVICAAVEVPTPLRD